MNIFSFSDSSSGLPSSVPASAGLPHRKAALRQPDERVRAGRVPHGLGLHRGHHIHGPGLLLSPAGSFLPLQCLQSGTVDRDMRRLESAYQFRRTFVFLKKKTMTAVEERKFED
ncbi:hypothetical protein CDAR_473211 [Caerostris darwini]|uniref:Uncharacterized protein n=1 Tax=Caerostris darwini TaxID=1538125 RepID=A0AAV4PNL8_9ARAC|nr:hypothetical protein CDAR_473091 [Caerostris darwini]GIX97396.1 hypothetical protein CDAR_473211 [Caerostris darwini]